jgi:predicted nucleotidyltransferase component of viral defense system
LGLYIETILAEKVETVLRRSVLNTRLRDFYDIYILTKTCQQAIDKVVFLSALKATAEQRQSLAVLEDTNRILQQIQADAVMRQRWERYCGDYYYANGIGFDEVMGALVAIVN